MTEYANNVKTKNTSV